MQTNPSNHALSGAALVQSLGLVHNRNHMTTIRSFREVWFDLEETINPQAGLRAVEERVQSCNDAFDLLTAALNLPADKELLLEENIFKALEIGLEKCGLTDKKLNQEKRIILKTDDQGLLAVGIIRQLDTARGLRGEMGESRRTFPDYCSCLLEKVGGWWVVKDGFSMVEFKKGDEQLKELIKSVKFESDHVALGQVVSYTIGYALPYQARRGVLGDYLPWTVIAGQIKKKDEPDFACRYVYGTLVPPEALGDKFTYTIEDDGQGSQRDGEKVDRILSVLLDTILFGIRCALKVFEAPNLTPCTASGQKLILGGVETTLPLVASPIRGANSIEGGLDWNVSQGDFFQGTIKLRQILDGIEGAFCLTFTETEEDEDVDVLIKVSSSVAHFPLIPASQAFLSLRLVQTIPNDQLQLELNRVLFAAIKTDAGLITIMTDLTKQGYDVLRPSNMLNPPRRTTRIQMMAVWDGFKLLVKDVLLPMARLGIVHPDIRPGFDVTANILWRLEEGIVKMVLIDLESLVFIGEWSTNDKSMYINPGEKWNATTFVAWQCVAVAYAWSQQLGQYVRGSTTCMNMEFLFSGVKGDTPLLHLPTEVRDFIVTNCKGRMNVDSVEQTMGMLDNLFHGTADT